MNCEQAITEMLAGTVAATFYVLITLILGFIAQFAYAFVTVCLEERKLDQEFTEIATEVDAFIARYED